MVESLSQLKKERIRTLKRIILDVIVRKFDYSQDTENSLEFRSDGNKSLGVLWWLNKKSDSSQKKNEPYKAYKNM